MPSVESFFSDCDALTSGKSHLQILQETRNLLQDKCRWTTGARARNSLGRAVKVEDPEATSWSIEGAVARVCNPYGITPISILRLLDRAVGVVHQGEKEMTACMYNDARNYEAVLEMLDVAIVMKEVGRW